MHFLPFAVLSSWQRSLLQWLGCDFTDAPANAKAELLWTNLPASWGVFVLLAVVAAIVYAIFAIYRRELDSCPNWAKILLAMLRAGAVLLLACIFLGPAVVYLQNRTVQPTIVIFGRNPSNARFKTCLAYKVKSHPRSRARFREN